MALIDKASLLMVPSTYEAGKLYNVLPSGNRAPDNKGGAGYDQTRADFDFDRGSNAAATRIDSNGVLQKYRENKLLQSNQFDTTWVNSNTTETGGQEDKDGGTDAWLLTKSAVAGGYIAQTKSTSGVSTASVYVKAGTIDTITLWCNQVGGGNPFGTFNLATQTLTDSGTIVDSNITSVGIDWYRVSITFSVNTTLFRIYVNNFSDTTAGSIYIQSAQLESGLVATDYLDSTSVTGKAGVLVDLPRINYDANGENGSLLLEPSRQQLFNYSEYFGDWGVSAGTLTANSATSPEGVKNAYLFTEDTTTGYHRFAKNSGGSNSTKTFSVFAKWAGGSGRKWLTMDNGPICYFDLENGVKGNVGANCTADIEDYGNGWYRCYFTHTNSITGTLYIGSSNTNGGSGNHLGNGENAFYLYGAQAEDGATYPSSYIPNHLGTGGVTRAADSCSVTGASDVIGQTEGTIFAEFDSSQFLTGSYIGISDGNATHRQIFGWEAQSGDSGTLRLYGFWNGFAYSSFSKGQKIKVALAYKNNDFALYVNGTQAGTKTSGTISGTLSQFGFNSGGGSQKYQGNAYQLALFKERLSNAELATLTTL